MTEGFALWKWFQSSMDDPRLRAGVEVVLLAPDGATERVRFQLSRCVPVKMKAPALNAKDGTIAIEELQIAYETLQLALPE
jgi:phage tail-like protein